MKKMMTLLLAFALVLSLAACGGGNDGEPASDTGSTAAADQAPPAFPETNAPDVAEFSETDPADNAEVTPQPGDLLSPDEKPEESRELPAPDPKPADGKEPAVMPQPDPQPEESAPQLEEAPAAPVEEPATPAASAATAEGYIGQSVSSLISAIGNPVSRTYAPSCLGEGEDGELAYSGFTVYTYREDGTETVQAVE